MKRSARWVCSTKSLIAQPVSLSGVSILLRWSNHVHSVTRLAAVSACFAFRHKQGDSSHRQTVRRVSQLAKPRGCIMPGIILSPQIRKELRELGKPISKRKGTVLFRAGEQVRGAFVIHSGEVKLTLPTDADVYPVRVVGSGAVIGLPATFSGEPYSLTAEVAKDCELDFIPRRRLLNLLLQNPKAGFQIVRMLSEGIFRMRRAASAMHRAQGPRIGTRNDFGWTSH